jgi:predicted anti-sigma-YlaC factor YlaD
MQSVCDEIAVLLSGYIDGELNDDERAQVDQHLAGCETCRRELTELQQMVEVTDSMKLMEPPNEIWKNYWNGVYNRIERGAGWSIFAAGLAVLVAYGTYVFLTDPGVDALIKVLIATPIVGLAVVFLSVWREKRVVNRHDKYKDIQR